MPFQGQKEENATSSQGDIVPVSTQNSSHEDTIEDENLLQDCTVHKNDEVTIEENIVKHSLDYKYGIKDCYVRLEELCGDPPIRSLLEQIQICSSDQQSSDSDMAIDSPSRGDEVHEVSVSVHRICSNCPKSVIC